MGKIYNCELKGIKTLKNEGFIGNLYYKNKKIINYIDNNDGSFPKIEFIKNDLKDDFISVVKDFYNKYPKEMIDTKEEYLIVEFVEELYRLKELENIFKKLNKKEETVLILLKFSKRTDCITNYEKEDICLSSTLWNDEFKDKLLEKYKPIEYIVYKSLEDFDIN